MLVQHVCTPSRRTYSEAMQQHVASTAQLETAADITP